MSLSRRPVSPPALCSGGRLASMTPGLCLQWASTMEKQQKVGPGRARLGYLFVWSSPGEVVLEASVHHPTPVGHCVSMRGDFDPRGHSEMLGGIFGLDSWSVFWNPRAGARMLQTCCRTEGNGPGQDLVARPGVPRAEAKKLCSCPVLLRFLQKDQLCFFPISMLL